METGDPYNVNIEMTNESKNRNAEFAETYLKAIGVRMNFIQKVKKKVQAFVQHCVKFNKPPKDTKMKECVRFIDEPNYDYWAHYKERVEMEKMDKSGFKECVKFKFKPFGKE